MICPYHQLSWQELGSYSTGPIRTGPQEHKSHMCWFTRYEVQST